MLQPFINLIKRFTKAPQKGEAWINYLVEHFVGRYVVESAIIDLYELKWDLDIQPIVTEEKYEFQFYHTNWNKIATYAHLECKMLIYADFILKNARTMKSDPEARKLLRFATPETKIYWTQEQVLAMNGVTQNCIGGNYKSKRKSKNSGRRAVSGNMSDDSMYDNKGQLEMGQPHQSKRQRLNESLYASKEDVKSLKSHMDHIEEERKKES